jgi:hypothetical protein
LQQREKALLDRRVQGESLQVEEELVENLMATAGKIGWGNRLKGRQA